MRRPEPWMQRARCLRRRDLPWIHERFDVGQDDEAAMAAVCERCPVLAQCGVYADHEEISSGFWAGEFRDPPADAVDGAA